MPVFKSEIAEPDIELVGLSQFMNVCECLQSRQCVFISQPVRHVKYSLFRKSLLGSVSDNGVVTLWDVNSQSSYHSFDSTHKAPASGICFSPVNELLFVTIGLDKRIILYDTSSKK